jgi:subtilase family serine protease
MRRIDKINIKNVFKTTLIVMFFIASMSMTFGVVSAATPANQLHENYVPVCSKEVKGTFRCFSEVVADITGKPKSMVTPNAVAYGPADFLNAYNLSGKTNTNQIIAIVDPFDDPNIISDLNTYNSQFNLPSLGNCAVNTGTPQSPCFQKVDQRGGTNYPNVDLGWALEISLDVEIAHAICQNCNILLVESDDNSYNNLMTAIDRAVTMGANTISNSYGSGEIASETSFDSHLNLPGKAILFASGDGGWAAGPQYPAASPYVTAVGGTTLFTNPRSEIVWSGSGSGCSIYESKPSFQKDTGCSKRTIADVSADADPNTGANIYDSLSGGWFLVGGTSLSTPLIAGVYAQAGGFSGPGNAVPYNNYIYGTNLYDVTSGANGNCGTYICKGVSGYDGPTGLGTPIGIGAFGRAPLNSITVTSPNGGENWKAGTTQAIKWTSSGSPGTNVKIELLKGGTLNSTITTSTPISTNPYNWTIPSNQTPGNDYKMKITSTTNPVYNDSSNANFNISTLTPGITVVSPNGGENWKAGTTQAIKWTSSGSPGTNVKIELLKGGTLNSTITTSTPISTNPYNWTIPSNQTPGNDYKMKITSTTNPVYNDSSNANFNISAPPLVCNTSTIYGYSFNDSNANKTKEPGEGGLSNWTINLNGYDTCGGTLVSNSPYAKTRSYLM